MDYADLKREWEDKEDVMVCHTSGSTGKPSKIELPKKEMKNSAKRSCAFFNINQESLLYSAISPDFIGGKMMWIRSRVSGAKFEYEKPSNRPLENYSGSPIDLISVVPSQMIYLLDNPDKLKLVRCFLIGGAPVPHQIRKRIIKLGINAYESYGMTETSSHIALKRIADNIDYFTLLPDISISLHKNHCLAIEIEGWKKFYTNDIAEIYSEKEFKILGRIDNVIITGGKKVYPEEIERILHPHLEIPFFITSSRDLKWGEAVTFVYTENMSPKLLDGLFQQYLLPHQRPKIIRQIDRLPLTSNGKIKRIKY